jgi:hypothetical protein
MFISQNMTDKPGPPVETFSRFLERVEADKLKEVAYGGGTELAYVTSDGKASSQRRRRHPTRG